MKLRFSKTLQGVKSKKFWEKLIIYSKIMRKNFHVPLNIRKVWGTNKTYKNVFFTPKQEKHNRLWVTEDISELILKKWIWRVKYSDDVWNPQHQHSINIKSHNACADWQSKNNYQQRKIALSSLTQDTKQSDTQRSIHSPKTGKCGRITEYC